MPPEARCGFFEAENGGGAGAAVGEDVVDSAGQGFDWAVVGAGAFVVDALAFDAALLVGNSHGGFGGLEQCREW